MAEGAEYVYDRGGTEITGPTIDLLTVIANCWGNIQFGFRELTQGHGESTVEAFAWDLETNSKSVKVFTVPHKRVTKRGTTALTDPRDVYELVANQAQRRVRACLEAIIPPDVVEDAVLECRATLSSKVSITPESIGKMVSAWAKVGVSKEQIEKRLGRRVDAIQPAQFVRFQAIYKSIQDGMSKPADWFEQPEGQQPQQTAADAAKDALRKQATTQTETPKEIEQATEPSSLTAEAETAFLDAESIGDCEAIRVSLTKKATTDADKQMLLDKAEARANAIRAARGTRSNKEAANA